jgi:hypothetical protein
MEECNRLLVEFEQTRQARWRQAWTSFPKFWQSVLHSLMLPGFASCGNPLSWEFLEPL